MLVDAAECPREEEKGRNREQAKPIHPGSLVEIAKIRYFASVVECIEVGIISAMVKCCVVPLCRSTRGRCAPSTSFHEFPSDIPLRNKWLDSISRAPKPGSNEPWMPTDHSSVCSLHFTAEDFVVGAKRKRLKRGAIPTLFGEHCLSPRRCQVDPLKRTVRDAPKNEPNTVLSETSVQVPPVTAVELPVVADLNAVPNGPSQVITTESRAVQYEAQMRPISCQTKLSCTQVAQLYTKLGTLSRKLRRDRVKLESIQSRLDSAMSQLREAQQKLAYYNVMALEQKLVQQDPKALFLKEQLVVLDKLKPRWTEETIQHLTLWHAHSEAAYNFVRDSQLLSLPCPSTLKRYVGSFFKTSSSDDQQEDEQPRLSPDAYS